MRYLIFMLLIGLPFIGGATVAAPISQGKTTIAQQAIPHGFSPKKHRFFERFAKNILQKRFKNALRRSGGEAEKWLSVLGFACSALGVFIFINSPIAALVLLAAGLVLSILGLALSSRETELWVKIMAIVGIVPPAALLIFMLAWLVS